jgi:hypothetical protein
MQITGMIAFLLIQSFISLVQIDNFPIARRLIRQKVDKFGTAAP